MEAVVPRFHAILAPTLHKTRVCSSETGNPTPSQTTLGEFLITDGLASQLGRILSLQQPCVWERPPLTKQAGAGGGAFLLPWHDFRLRE